MKTRKFQFWASCAEVTDYTSVTLAELVQWDDNAVSVTREEFEQVADVTPFVLESINDQPELFWLLYPDKENPKSAMIYDSENDIHFIFI